jgi:hypothetical protein
MVCTHVMVFVVEGRLTNLNTTCTLGGEMYVGTQKGIQIGT